MLCNFSESYVMEICIILFLRSAFSYRCIVVLPSFAVMVIFLYIKKLLTQASDENESISVRALLWTSVNLYTAVKASTVYIWTLADKQV
jgi:hypothetical protein